MSRFTPRVLYMSEPVSPPWNRSDKNLVRLVAGNLTRYRAHVLTHEGAVGVEKNVDMIAAWGPKTEVPASMLQRIALFNRVLTETDAQLVHLFWPADLILASIVRGACGIRGLPMIHTLVRAPRSTVAIRRTTAGDPVVCLSRATLERVQREGTVSTVHIPPGVRTQPPMPQKRHAEIRERYGFPHDTPLCIYAGDYLHSNAARTVAATVPRVLRETECHFVMACRRRDQKDREEEARIKEAITADGLANHVSFVGEVKNLRELLAVSDVQLFPADSHHEKMDMPMVLLEGLAEGLATVVANKQPLDELVDAGAAIGVPPMQPVALAVAIVELLRDEQKREQLRAAARSVVERRFSIERVTAAYEDLYDQALGIQNRPAVSA